MFQIQHQTQELWLKCAAFETVSLVETLDNERTIDALAVLDRIVLVTQSLADQIRVLFTLSPSRFHVIRRSLGNGSGLESPGYNQLLAAAEAAETALERLLTRRETTLMAIYDHSDRYPDLCVWRSVSWTGTPPRNRGWSDTSCWCGARSASTRQSARSTAFRRWR